MSDALVAALPTLPEAEAEVLWLYHAGGRSFESIGEHLGIGRKAVRGIYARGLNRLKDGLGGNP